MDLSRIEHVIDTARIQRATVATVGGGGSAGLLCGLTRCGVRRHKIIDHDRVSPSNIARQAHQHDAIGAFKTDAAAKMIHAINPDAQVESLPFDFTAMSNDEIDAHLADVDLLILGTDCFGAQARGNEVAQRLALAAMWIGLYRGGRAGELIFWHSDLDSCFRCLCGKRYSAHEQARARGKSLDPPSDGATIFDIHYLDALAGQIAVGLLTRGSNNRFGRLIAQLGDRNFLQVKIDPTWTWGGRDVIREQLGIAPDCPAYLSWNTIARSDPDHGQPPCPDCVKYRGRRPTVAAEAEGSLHG